MTQEEAFYAGFDLEGLENRGWLQFTREEGQPPVNIPPKGFPNPWEAWGADAPER